jgi:hypothetical protein
MKLSVFKKALERDINIIRTSFVILLLLSVLCLFKFGEFAFGGAAKDIDKYFNQKDAIIDKAVLGDTSTLSQKIKLKEQYAITKEIKKAYFYMAKSFNSFGFSFTMVFVLSSIASAALGFLVLKKGWDNTENFYLKSSFLVLFFSASLFGVLPKVFYNKENTKNNFDKYNYYSGLQMDIYDLFKDNNRYIIDGNLKTLDTCISNINANIKANQDLYFDTEISNVPKDINPGQ